MKLFYYKDPQGVRNFGDDMNPWFWEKFLPNGFDDKEGAILVGIGTLLNDLHRELYEKTDRVVVFGSGVGYGKQPPSINDHWTIYCVRGPLSAQALGLDARVALTDPAILVNQFVLPSNKRYKFSYIPHAIHANSGIKQVCEDSNIHYIDPGKPIQDVFTDIADTEVILTEAMHGAIIGNALRVPWIPIVTAKIINSFKWKDWCASVGLEYNPNSMMPVWGADRNASKLGKLRNGIRLGLARRQLVQISRKAKPQLSSDEVVNTLTDRLLETMERLRGDVQSGRYR